ncbi:MAG TPA: hypothetical protein PL151_15895 [Phycisphaerae bacterium]|nr:hypothetical protein [Phycisphaerae bacterium]HOJ73431.1 hypothetical protein [Phycisphaerae bacterium]HOM51040.1 hypothetical protein [Phycisphaerae bacterium]HON66311.1 hypothetical protein [Phycisphaerae bacterium]HOQ85185.1 hypothetical protein [Phycisphaerae bacterium]
MTSKGTVRGKTIELDEHLSFPEGATVMVSVSASREEPERGAPEAILRAVESLPELEPGDVDELERVIAESRMPLSKPARL